MELERRAAAAEIRAAGRKLEGYAATFGTEARIGSYLESIAAGAFAASLADGGDKLALVDHDPGKLLARTRSGTLRLAEDSRGLAFDLDVPDTQLGRDMLELARRSDLGGMSFAFKVRPDGERWTGQRRELRAVDLAEVSVILSWPAYPDTKVAARNRPRDEAPDAGLRRAMTRWRP
ncbi:HK97 family phage prohead protease [Reyranella sp.]|uniref:HK97 family phage prohead protease n=1 Tax=Reyranella sp. TaxID=1929291 RepID=UPI00272F7843|nr:HK97 family phage prohead protease [Reyranella sp.]MDP2376096.1 HK97 family phage prohead protease [Reyranella sp.]